MRFTIRDLVLVTVIAAMGLGWWLDHRALANSCNNWMSAAIVLRPYADDSEYTFKLDDDGGLSFWGDEPATDN